MTMDNKQPENINNTVPDQQPSPDQSAAVVAQCGGKLHCYDWLSDIPESHDDTEMVEVQFKNTRKGYYKNSVHLRLEKGDVVAVEGNPGHDIGVVSLTGRLVLLQMKKNGVKLDNPDLKRVYRKAKPNDLEKYKEAKAREHSTMLRARKIAEDLHLNMKIGDVEYQGDGNKAIFYYITVIMLVLDPIYGFSPVNQGFGRSLPGTYRDEANRRPSRSRAYRGYRPMRTSTLLLFMDEQFRIGSYQRRSFSGYFLEPAKIGGTVCKAQMLP